MKRKTAQSNSNALDFPSFKNLESLTTAALPAAQWQQYAEAARRFSIDWSGISPEIFGSLFQEVLTATERRFTPLGSLGAHYTSEKNILRLIEPLLAPLGFLDEPQRGRLQRSRLREEFKAVRKNEKKLEAFRGKLHKLRFLDPACKELKSIPYFIVKTGLYEC